MDFSLDIGSLLGGITSALGGVYSSNLSADSAYELSERQMAYNSEEAQKARNFAALMSNTAYQRSVEDLRQAGLNPMLAISNGGASTPSASAASAGSLPTPDYSSLSRIGSGLQGALTAQYKKQNEKVDAEKENIKANTNKTKVDTVLDAANGLTSLAVPAASAYAAKKSADVAKQAISKGMTKESAKAFAKDVVGHSPATSAYSSSKVFENLGALALGLLPFGLGVKNDVSTSKKMSSKDFKEWSNIRASGYGY